jgi:N6-L-threonylcarbamoyladenine synthase
VRPMCDDLIVLGVETSCDETAAAVVACGRHLLSSVVSSQIEVHRRFGGVVPEIASRKHVESVIPVVDEALRQAGVTMRELGAVAVTYGPGLVGALLVGLSAAKGLAFASRVPMVCVNHIEAHIYANFLAHPGLEPPLVCLTVSGGHTDLVAMEAHGQYTVLGRTRDDAAGEAFDKVARVMGLPYPGGPALERLARDGNPEAIRFPLSRVADSPGDFSFSGLKTAVINYLHAAEQRGEHVSLPDIAASFQRAVVEELCDRVSNALRSHRPATLALSGGVAANGAVRGALRAVAEAHGVAFVCPPPELCTDNAAMVACAGYYQFVNFGPCELSANACPGADLPQRRPSAGVEVTAGHGAHVHS